MDILDIQQVTKTYASHIALKNVSLRVPKGSIYGLLGPNGAGKTSLIRIITQITAADSGQILFNGEKLASSHIARIGYLPEERGLYKKMKVGEQLVYLARLKGLSTSEVKKKLAYWVKQFDISTWWGKPVEDLSKGMQQKVQFIATVMHEPELLILDEPFSGFDPVNANIIKDEILKLRERGCSIIFSTHRMESVEELCDYIALINKSEKILEGLKADIKNQYRSNTFMLETSTTFEEVPGLFHIQQQHKNEYGRIFTRLQLSATSTNDLLGHLIQQTDVYSLQEHLPTMNEIFIKSVGAEKAAELLES